MFASQTVLGFLDRAGVDFELVTHPHVFTSSAAALSAAVPITHMAKGVLFHNDQDLLLAVVPAARRVNTWAVSELAESEHVQLVDERELSYVFRDCERGAVPVVGAAFGVRNVVDEALLSAPDLYFEAGDHERLVHMTGSDFAHLMRGQMHGWIAC